MEKDKKPADHKPTGTTTGSETGHQPKGKVLAMPVHCHAEGCKKKLERAEFCNEHFLWFKAGLLKKDGSYPKDFDKKYIQYMRKAAA